MVTATVDDRKLAEYVLQVPRSIRDEIRKKTSTSADFREGAVQYYVQYSPQATWAELAGRLYYLKYYIKCGEALAAAKRFIKRMPGNCVYIPLSNSPSSNVNYCLVVQVNAIYGNIEYRSARNKCVLLKALCHAISADCLLIEAARAHAVNEHWAWRMADKFACTFKSAR